jgi:hypothetical protein
VRRLWRAQALPQICETGERIALGSSHRVRTGAPSSVQIDKLLLLLVFIVWRHGSLLRIPQHPWYTAMLASAHMARGQPAGVIRQQLTQLRARVARRPAIQPKPHLRGPHPPIIRTAAAAAAKCVLTAVR